MSVRFTAEAEDDLEGIADWIARDDPARALAFLRVLRLKCSELAATPRLYPLVSRYERQGVRRRLHGDHLIFYRIDGDAVEIVHVLHGARDYASILFPD